MAVSSATDELQPLSYFMESYYEMQPKGIKCLQFLDLHSNDMFTMEAVRTVDDLYNSFNLQECYERIRGPLVHVLAQQLTEFVTFARMPHTAPTQFLVVIPREILSTTSIHRFQETTSGQSATIYRIIYTR